jgi:hypothetical protein
MSHAFLVSFIYKMVCECIQCTHGSVLAINLARLEGGISRRKDPLTALRIRLVSYCWLLPVRLKLDDMDPKYYSAAYWCNVRFGPYDHLCNPFYLLLMAVTMIPITLCESQQWFWDCDGLHNGHFEFAINSRVLQVGIRAMLTLGNPS